MNLINYILVAMTLCYGSYGVIAVPIGLGRTSQLAARQVNSLDIRAEIDSELALEVRAHGSDVGGAPEPQGGDTATTKAPSGAEAPTKGQEAPESSTKGRVASEASASGQGATGHSKVSAHGQGGNGGYPSLRSHPVYKPPTMREHLQRHVRPRPVNDPKTASPSPSS